MEYDEGTFLFFLGVERARAGRARHPLRLLFATFEPVPGQPVLISASSATRLLEGMKQTLRETDVVGWYRQDRVAGAVLGARPDEEGTERSGLIEQRVGDGLRQRLPSKVARSLRVRVVQLGPPQLASA